MIFSKRVRYSAILLFLVFAFVADGDARDVTLAWNESHGPDVAGYMLHYKGGAGGEPYDGTGAVEGDSPIDVGNVTTYSLAGLDDSEDYFFVVTAYNSQALESGYSNQVSVSPVSNLITDIAITAVSPFRSTVNQGDILNVSVTARNTGDQHVTSDITVTLESDLYGPIATQTIGGGLSSGAYTTLRFPWDTGIVSIGEHTLTASHDVIDDESSNDSGNTTVEVAEQHFIRGPYLQTGKVMASTDTWTTVNLDQDYGDEMVVVCTPNYDKNTAPVVTRVRNAFGTRFQVLLSRTAGTGNITIPVHWVVVEAGVYNEAEHGVKMEALKFTSTVTDNRKSWKAQARSYANSYNQPVVVGQVMTYNDPRWSVFWSRSRSSYKTPPNSTIKVGKHVGEDKVRMRADETIGYIVMEAGSNRIGSTNCLAGLGTDSIGGAANRPPYRYTFSGLNNPSIAIVSQAAMDGNNGGWGILYGESPVTTSALRIAIDEDQARDTERSHTTEQVAYIVCE